jgi:hypothetical protein
MMRHLMVWKAIPAVLALCASPLHAQPVPDTCRLIFGGTPDAGNRHGPILDNHALVRCTRDPQLPVEDPPSGHGPHIIKAWNCVAKPQAGAQLVYDLVYQDLHNQQRSVNGQSDGGVMFWPIPDTGNSQCKATLPEETNATPDPCASPYVLKLTTCGGIGTMRCTGNNRNWCLNSSR